MEFSRTLLDISRSPPGKGEAVHGMNCQGQNEVELLHVQNSPLVYKFFQDATQCGIAALHSTDHPVGFSWTVVHGGAKGFSLTPEIHLEKWGLDQVEVDTALHRA